jgi:subtilisin family serine protease
MRQLLVILITWPIFLLSSCGDQSSKAIADQGNNYFYLNGKKVWFTEVKGKLPIRITSGNKGDKALRDELNIDTSFKFMSNIVIAEKEEADRSNNSIKSRFAEPGSDDLGMLIKLNGSKSHFILTDRMIAKFKPTVTDKMIDSIVKMQGCSVVERSTARKGRVIIQCDVANMLRNANAIFESSLTEYAHPDFIAQVELRAPFYPNDVMFKDQWHLNNTGQGGGTANADINAPEAWEITRGNPNVVIAVIDDAFDVAHEDLKDNLLLQKDFSAEPDDNDPSPDETGREKHGTSVAGVAVAKGNNGVGVSGSCPECKFIAIRALDNNVSNQANAFDYAVTSGASIISNSWGYNIGTPQTDDVVDAINNAAQNGRNGRGCVIFFAMTNTPTDNCSGPNPDISSLASVIAVSQSTNQDRLGNGGRGACMDLIAPTRGGTLGITTTDITGVRGYSSSSYTDNFGGTSSATPLVAGVAGLMLSVNANLTRQQVQLILQNNADKIDAANANYVNGFSKTHGHGRVNALKAVKAVNP